MSKSFQIVTVADREPKEPWYKYREFLASCRKFGHEPVVLGWGQPFKGLGTKPRTLLQAINSGVVNADAILFCDAFDVLFADNPEHLVGYAPDSIIFNAEKSCFPNAALAELHPPSSTPWRYLNSGLSIGSLDSYVKFLTAMDALNLPEDVVGIPGKPNIHHNDQGLIMEMFVSGKHPLSLDTRCDIFQTLHCTTETELDFSGTHIRNTVTDTFPVGFHANGDKLSPLARAVYSRLA